MKKEARAETDIPCETGHAKKSPASIREQPQQQQEQLDLRMNIWLLPLFYAHAGPLPRQEKVLTQEKKPVKTWAFTSIIPRKKGT